MSKKNYKVVIVDDDPVVQTILRTVFLREGWSVLVADNGESGLPLIRQKNPDLVILDLMLPGIDGWEICQLLREETDVPILMLTALDQEDALVKGLQLGADDYVPKPFSPREVVARAYAILRRVRPEKFSPHPVTAGPLLMDSETQEAFVDGNPLKLTPAEFRILYYLVENQEKVVARQKILEIGSGRGAFVDGFDRTADAHIKNLRRKLAEAASATLNIKTIRGLGYKLTVERPKG